MEKDWTLNLHLCKQIGYIYMRLFIILKFEYDKNNIRDNLMQGLGLFYYLHPGIYIDCKDSTKYLVSSFWSSKILVPSWCLLPNAVFDIESLVKFSRRGFTSTSHDPWDDEKFFSNSFKTSSQLEQKAGIMSCAKMSH